jgi:cytidine deaminase
MARLDQTLVEAAIELLESRFPESEGIAAAVRTDDGQVLTSVVFVPEWGGGGLGAETGAILEAHKLSKRVVAVACVSRLSGNASIIILTPCGICQERLFHWGVAVEIAIPDPNDPTKWVSKTLAEVQPYYWVNVYKQERNPFNR